MRFALQFFLYYVFWPGAWGFGQIFSFFVAPDFYWWFLIGWPLLWVLPPLGVFRRRFSQQIQEGLEEEQVPGQDTIPPGMVKLLILALIGLAFFAGSMLGPLYLEKALGVDLQARLEESQHG